MHSYNPLWLPIGGGVAGVLQPGQVQVYDQARTTNKYLSMDIGVTTANRATIQSMSACTDGLDITSAAGDIRITAGSGNIYLNNVVYVATSLLLGDGDKIYMGDDSDSIQQWVAADKYTWTFRSLSGVDADGGDLEITLQDAGDGGTGNHNGGSLVVTGGALQGTGAAGTATFKVGSFAINDQAGSSNKELLLDSGLTTANTFTIASGSSLTAGLEIATGAGGIVLDAVTGITLEAGSENAFSLNQGELTASGTDDYALKVTSTLNDNSAGGTDDFRLFHGDVTVTDDSGWDEVYVLDLWYSGSSVFDVDKTGTMTPVGGIFLGDDVPLKWGNTKAAPDSTLKMDTAQAASETMVWGLHTTSKTLIIGDQALAGQDYDHAAAANPTLIIHSATDPDSANTQYVSFTHDQTDAVYVAGTGDHKFTGSIKASNAAGPAFADEAATDTNPTLIPDKAEMDTGIGWASDTLHMVLGGTSYANFSTTKLTLAGDIELTSGGTIQSDSGDITLDSAGAILLDTTDPMELKWGGTALLKLDDASVSEFVATAAAGTSTYLRAQSGADNAAGTGYAGAGLYIKAGEGGDATAGDNDGGAGGPIVLEPGDGGAESGTGDAGADGTVIIRQPGGTPGTHELQIRHGGSYVWIDEKSGTSVVLALGGTPKCRAESTAFRPHQANAYGIGSSTTEWLSGYFGEDTSTGSVSTSGLYLGTAQEARLRYNKDLANMPANSLILGHNTTGNAAVDAIAISSATVSGFNSLTTVAGRDSYIATQSGLDNNTDGGSLIWEMGAAHGSGTGGTFKIYPGGTTSGTRGHVGIHQDGIETTSTDGFVLENATAATVGTTEQYSPRFRQRAHAWDTDGSADTWDFWQEVVPASAATTSATWYLRSSKNGAAATDTFWVSSGGNIYASGAIFAGASGSGTVACRKVTTNTGATITFHDKGFSNSDSVIEAVTGEMTQSTGETLVGFHIRPKYTQTNDASGVDFAVTRWENSVGTGEQLLAFFGTSTDATYANATFKAKIDNSGNLTLADGASLRTGTVDDDFIYFGACDNDDQSIKEVARLQGAAGTNQYFSAGGTQEFKFYQGGTASFGGAITCTSTLGFSAGTTITEFSTDGTLGDDSDDAVPTEKAVKTYVDGAVAAKDQFTELTDTPGGYTTANAIYTTNGTPDAVIETTVQLTEAANNWNITKGTAIIDVNAATVDVDANLTVSAACTLDQDVQQSASPTFAGLALGAGSLTLTGSIAATGSRVTKVWTTDLEVTNDITINGNALATIYQPLDANLTSLAGQSHAVGDLLYATAATTYGALAAVGAGQVLVSQGATTAPAWSATPTLTSLTLTNAVNEFSTDGTLGDNSDSAVPTEKAVKTYVDNNGFAWGASATGGSTGTGLTISGHATDLSGTLVSLDTNNTNSANNATALLVAVDENSGAGTNSGIFITNANTAYDWDATTAPSGTGLHIYQSGVAGTALSVCAANNIHTSGLITSILSDTQDAAAVGIRSDLGGANQAMVAFEAHGDSANADAIAFDADMETGFSGDFFRGQVNGVEKFAVDKDGNVDTAGSVTVAASKSIDAYTNSGYVKVRRVSQAAQPAAQEGELLIWRDTDDDKTYLVIQDADVGARKVELT